MSKKAAIYLRVSTTDQNYERQERDLRALAQSLGYEVISVYEEKASAVLKADTREELNKMRQLTKADVDRIFIWDITRLSRRSIDFINIVNEFSQKKICLHFKDKNIVTLEDDGTENVLTSLYLYILGTFAQMDAENLKAKFRSGKKNGYLNGTSHTPIAPFGYYIEDKKLKIDEDAARWVKYIYESYVEGKSLTEIVDTLNANRVTSVRGKKWTKMSLSVVLKNPTYKGKPNLTLKYRDNNKEIVRTEEMHLTCDAIIDEALWEKAQQQRDKNRHDVDKTKVTEALLRGIIRCGECGSSYIVMESSKYNLKQYVCSDRLKGSNTRVFCKNGGIKVDTIDSIVWTCIKDVYTYQRFKDSFKAEKEEGQAKLNNNNMQIANIREDIAELDKRTKKVNAGWIDGIIDDNEARDMKLKIANEKARKEAQIATLEAENLNLNSKLNQDFSNYKLPETELTYEEKKVVFNEQIESAKMFAFGKTKRVVELKLKVGLTYYIAITSTRCINYYVVEGTIADFSNGIFKVHDKQQVLFKDADGEYDFEGMWELMDNNNLIVNMQ